LNGAEHGLPLSKNIYYSLVDTFIWFFRQFRNHPRCTP